MLYLVGGRFTSGEFSCREFRAQRQSRLAQLLNAAHLLDVERLREFVLLCQDNTVGGFSKHGDSEPGAIFQQAHSLSPIAADVLHTYMALAGLALLREPTLSSVDASLNVCSHVAARLQRMALRADGDDQQGTDDEQDEAARCGVL